MTLPASGTMSMSQVATEFSKTPPMVFSALYGITQGIPASGTMSLSNFYGKTAGPSAPSTPMYGTGVLETYNESSVLALVTTPHTYTSGQNITLNQSDNYGYFIVPDSYNPVFTDIAVGFAGGWDGASWPTTGDIGDGFGPVAVTIAGAAWKIYRTDFRNSGTVVYTVAY